MPVSTPYNILALDGGGSWALIQVRCLQALFGDKANGHEVLRRFDLVAANSGGSIVLAGLVANLPLSAILQIFLDPDARQHIFAPSHHPFWYLEHGLSHLTKGWVPDVGPRYITAQKLIGLQQHLPELVGLSLAEVPARVGGTDAKKPHVLITTFDYTRQRSSFFRSNLDSYGDSVNLEGQLFHTTPAHKPGKAVLLLEAVHASSTAPVNFFDTTAEVTVNDQVSYLWDGGVAGYNNPVLASVTEALVNGVTPADVRVLSIGTGTQVYPVPGPGQTPAFEELLTRPIASEGFLSDVRKLASAVVGAPPDAASFVAFTTLNPGFVRADFQNQNFIRANPSVQPSLLGDQWQPPTGFDASMIKAIRALELDAVGEEQVALIQKICDSWLADELPNQPIRASASLKCLVGQSSFAEVKSLFQQIFTAP